MKIFLSGLAAPFLLFPAAVLAFFALGMGDPRSDVTPPRWETLVMKSAVRASVQRSAKGLSSPAPANQEAIVAGGKLYLAGCAGCHGEPGKPYAEDHSGYPPAPQLPHTGSQYSEPEIVTIVAHGVRMTAMSAYRPFYKDDQLRALAAFVHRIDTLSPAEIQAIQPIKH
jgi:mono/diheme cytochrome c family protein